MIKIFARSDSSLRGQEFPLAVPGQRNISKLLVLYSLVIFVSQIFDNISYKQQLFRIHIYGKKTSNNVSLKQQ